ncbi:MAG: helix-turn-helix domain-containing protein [Rhodoblastus sp.]|nr:MAG: helix-turn-helix domain-containing protein [Rhodoblastus sp.]
MGARASLTIPVLVICPPRALLLDCAGPLEAFRKANLAQSKVTFAVRHVGPQPQVTTSLGLPLGGIAALPETAPTGAIVLVAGAVDVLPDGSGPSRQDARDERAIVDWLARAVTPGVRLVTICAGALLAARAGLLRGRVCTTHAQSLDALRRIDPTLDAREDRLFVEDGEVITSAGVTAGIDLALHLVARHAGEATAVAVARHLVVYLRRAGGDPQLSPWLQGRAHLHPALHRAQDAVAADPARDWPLARLARVAHVSERSLSRLFAEHAGMSATDYVARLRAARAEEMLAHSRLDMESVAERAGFGSARQMRRVFVRLKGAPPRAARARRPASDRAGG